MPTFFKVVSNLKHNGENFPKDSFMEGELEQLGHLVKDGVLLVVEGAESVEDAKVLFEAGLPSEPVAEVPAVEGANTWEPRKDPVVADVSKEEEVTPQVNSEANTGTPEGEKVEGAPGVVGQGDLPPVTDAGDNL